MELNGDFLGEQPLTDVLFYEWDDEMKWWCQVLGQGKSPQRNLSYEDYLF